MHAHLGSEALRLSGLKGALLNCTSLPSMALTQTSVSADMGKKRESWPHA